MASRGVLSRDRFRRDLGPSRLEDTSKRGSNPPSRHLWVGNLSHSLVERDLTHQFLQFGDLDSVAFQPGRSYAFINFRNDDDAIAALKALQGFPLAGNPLRIEFAKADKSTVTSREDDYSQRSALRGSPFSQKESRVRNASPDPCYGDKSRTSDRHAEASEVLWIGFPALLKVDEMILRKAFSPFGEIEKVTVFPGRSYAFVRFRNIISAWRAKETLEGKLFGNPRVHICFAKSEGSGRPPPLRSNGHLGAPESLRHDRNYGSSATESPNFMSNLDSDSDAYGFIRKGASYPGGSNTFDNWRFGEELGPPPDVYERRGSTPRERDDFPRKASYFEPWDLPEDSYLFHGAKKLKTGSFPPPEKELPEYPLSDLEQEKPQTFSDFSPPKKYGYTPQPDHSHMDRSDPLKASYPRGSGSLVEKKREPEQSSLKLWKWEGTIAKGGTPVCHAHGFPVGKALDIMLPEFLDCTARTGLDMLAKHYYQAACAWVVFFAPASDADIGYYNEFMHYLEEKQRAAVTKLDDKTTLFLVPPSDFSEKVLRVPGKLCISGVVLRLELPSGSFHCSNEKPSAPSSMDNFGTTSSDSYSDNRHIHQRSTLPGSNWSPHHPHNNNNISGMRNPQSQQASNIVGDPAMQEQRISYPFSASENKPSAPHSLPISALQPQQLAQLASSLLGQQQQQSSPMSEDIKLMSTSQSRAAQSHGLQNNIHHHHIGSSEISTSSMFGQLQPQGGGSIAPKTVPPYHGTQGNSQMQNTSSTQEETDADPQKRLQATLQLAAALLQQIQQGKGTT